MGAIWATNSNQPSINNRLELIQVAHYKFEIEHFVEIEIANLRRARACLKSSIIIIHVLQIGPTIECERMKKKNAFATNSCTKPRPVATNNEKKKVQHDKKHIANSVDTKSPAVVSRHRKKKTQQNFQSHPKPIELLVPSPTAISVHNRKTFQVSHSFLFTENTLLAHRVQYNLKFEAQINLFIIRRQKQEESALDANRLST